MRSGIGSFRRLPTWVAGWFASRNENARLSVESQRLRDQVYDMRATLNQVDAELRDSKTEIEVLKANLAIAREEIFGLSGVIERDRKRVEAETAIHARRIAGQAK